MPLSHFADRVKETTTTTGTGSLTLAGAATQYQAFSPRFAVGQWFYYAIVGQSGAEWETGQGYLSGASTLVRARVLQSSNSDALVNLSSGTKDVFVTIPADRANDWNTHGKVLGQIMGAALP